MPDDLRISVECYCRPILNVDSSTVNTQASSTNILTCYCVQAQGQRKLQWVKEICIFLPLYNEYILSFPPHSSFIRANIKIQIYFKHQSLPFILKII
jgi:hypothetical protein